MRDRVLLVFFLLAFLLRLFAFNAAGVEHWYNLGFYPIISETLRAVFGWLPFSVGDLLYALVFFGVIAKLWKLGLLVKRKRLREHLTWKLFRKYLRLCLVVYIVFNFLWGLNYYRQGIPTQLDLDVKNYSVQDLFDVTLVLQQRLNFCAEKVDSLERLRFNQSSFLFQKGEEAYRLARPQYPFLAYAHPSIKPSLFTPIGHLVGFTGYYNPFSAEAQVKTDIPVFLKPFVVMHEMAHQLGYAKENEASFVAYLTGKSSTDVNVIYSTYFELYRDAFFECRLTPNKSLVETIRKNIHPRVQRDAQDLQAYLLRTQNFIEPFMTSAYDRYLKLNNQPKGKATYDEVIAYLIAYMKKYGKAAI